MEHNDSSSRPASSARAMWEARLSAARAAGTTVAQVAAEHGVAVSTVFAWRRRISQPQAATSANGPMRFAKLERLGDGVVAAPSAGADAALVVEVWGVQVRVGKGADVALAAQLVRALAKVMA